METFTLDSYLIVTFLIVLAIIYHQLKKRWYFQRVGVRCAPTWPILGSLPSAMFKGILQHEIEFINTYGKVHGTYLGNQPSMVVADPDFIKEIFIKQFHNFPYRMQALYISDWWDNSVVMASGDHWRYMRSVITPALSTAKLKQMQPQLTESLQTMTQCLRKMQKTVDDGIIDMRKVLGALTMDVICCTAFGFKVNTLENMDAEFSKHAKIVSTLSIESNPLNGLPLIMPCFKKLFRLLDLDYVDKNSLQYVKSVVQSMISTRREENESRTDKVKDILQNLMNAHKDHDETFYDENGNIVSEEKCKTSLKTGLTDDELIANAIVVLMAGYDTTATTLTWMCYLLATNPDVQKKVINAVDEAIGDKEPTYENVSKIDYLDWFLSETLRLYPAANRTGRDAVVDTEVCGVTVPAGLSVTLPIYAIHRMPEYWSDPEQCIPERFSPERQHEIKPYTYMPFGVGPRICLGLRMAQMLCKLIMAKLVQDFRLDVSSETEKCPVLEKSLLTKPKNGMKLKLISRKV